MKSRLPSRENEGLPCRIVLAVFCMSTYMAFHLEVRLYTYILRITRNQEILNPLCCWRG